MLPPPPRINRRLPVIAATVAFGALLAAIAVAAPAIAAPRFTYQSPRPDARWVSPLNNVVLRADAVLDPSSLHASALQVTGAISGPHDGRLVLSDDGRTLVFDPTAPYAPGERVTVRFDGSVRALGGERLPSLAFGFTVSGMDPGVRAALAREVRWGDPTPPAASAAPETAPAGTQAVVLGCDTLPPDFPPMSATVGSATNLGRLFLTPSTSMKTDRGHLMIVDDYGKPLFYRSTPHFAQDFKFQPSGLLTYYTVPPAFVVLDSTYTPVDTIKAGNGYATDGHDLQILPDGHVLLMGIDFQYVDMSTIVPGGDPEAIVWGLIVQELDGDRNVVFQWRSWDHFDITDMVGCAGTLLASRIDYVHGNAVERDLDGNILLSSRHLSEITKIDRETGDILWRLGLNAKHNDFTFLNDARGFSMQHDVRRLPDGHLTLFDNGNCLSPQYSSALEYELDEVNMTATLVWTYRHDPDVFGPSMGNVQRRADGSTTICWGGTTQDPRVTDLHVDDSLDTELGFGIASRYTYRTFRFPWETSIASVTPSSLVFGTVATGTSATRSVVIRNRTAVDFTITCFGQSDRYFSVDQAAPLTIPAGDTATITVRFAPEYGVFYHGSVYVRAVNDTQVVAIPVLCLGVGSGPLPTAVADVAPGRFALYAASPNPFTGETTIRYDLPRAARVRLEVFDVRGRRVDTLVDGPMPAGRHPVVWSSRGRPGGVYFVRLDADGFTAARKAVILD